jgi:hypothetical protein
VDLPKCPLTLWPDGLRDMTADDEPDMGGMFIPCGPGELDEWIGRTRCQLCHNREETEAYHWGKGMLDPKQISIHEKQACRSFQVP